MQSFRGGLDVNWLLDVIVALRLRPSGMPALWGNFQIPIRLGEGD